MTARGRDGALLSRKLYKPWGELRAGTDKTGFQFTGQRWEESIGLYDFKARWYDPSIMMFTSPDTLIPDPNNPLDWNRYAYARYNPVKYTDPTGHFSDAAITAYLKQIHGENWESYWKSWQKDSSWMRLLHEAKAGDILARVVKSGNDFSLSYYQFTGEGNDLMTGLNEIASPDGNLSTGREGDLNSIYSSSWGLGAIRHSPGQDPIVVSEYGNIGFTGYKTSLGDVRLRNVAINLAGWGVGLTFEKWWLVGLLTTVVQGGASPEISNMPGLQEGDYTLFVSTVVDLSETEHIGERWDVWFRKGNYLQTDRQYYHWDEAGRRSN